MIQVLRARDKVPSTSAQFAQAFGNAIGNAGSAVAEGYGRKLRGDEEKMKGKMLRDQENEFAKETFGEDISNLHSPQAREQYFSEKFKGSNAEKLQKLKQQGKEDILNNQQSFLNSILSPKDKTLEQPSEISAETRKGFEPENIDDEDIIRAESLGIKGLREAKDAKLRKKEKEESEKRRTFESDRDFNSKISDPIIKTAESIVRDAPIKKALISQQRRDIASGNTEGIIPFMVDKLGLEAYRNPESARFKTASKERFVESVHELGSSGARANQFIEQQLVSAQAALGRDAEANQSVLDLEEFINDSKSKRAQLELDLADKDIEEKGYAQRDISRRADELMKPYIEQRQDEMAYDIRKRHEDTIDDQALTQEIVSGNIGPDTPLTLRAARILMIKNNDDVKKAQAEAKKLGFRLPSEQTYKR